MMWQSYMIFRMRFLDGLDIFSYPRGSKIFILKRSFGDLKTAGPVFMKGLRLSQVLGLNVVLKLRLLSQLSFVLKPYSERVT